MNLRKCVNHNTGRMGMSRTPNRDETEEKIPWVFDTDVIDTWSATRGTLSAKKMQGLMKTAYDRSSKYKTRFTVCAFLLLPCTLTFCVG